MKQTILITLCLIIPLTLTGKKIKRCKLDKRPFIERRIDYDKRVIYPSQFVESNSKPERLYLGEDVIEIGYSPLCDFKGIGAALAQNNIGFSPFVRAENPDGPFTEHIGWSNYENHPCKRDFRAEWVVKGDKLYLNEIELYTPEVYHNESSRGQTWKKRPMSEDDYLKRIYPHRQVVYARVQEATGRKWDDEGLIFADWFTGTLIGYQHPVNRNTGKFIEGTRKAVKIEVRKGMIKSVEIKPLIELKREDRRRLLFFERTQIVFGERIVR